MVKSGVSVVGATDPPNHIVWRYDMAHKIIPDSIRDCLSYDPETGVITYKVSRGSRSAGSVAGSIKGSTGYRVILFQRQGYLAHRVAWFLAHNEQPDIIDHINHDPLDNRLCNLRNVSTSANQLNRRSTCTMPNNGVTFRRSKSGGRWVAQCGGWFKSCGKSILMAHFHRHMYVTATYHPALPPPE